jgi:hypothetical protein
MVPTQSAVTAAQWALPGPARHLSRLHMRLEGSLGSREFRQRSCRVNPGAAFQVRRQLADRFGPSGGSDHRCPWHAPTGVVSLIIDRLPIIRQRVGPAAPVPADCTRRQSSSSKQLKPLQNFRSRCRLTCRMPARAHRAWSGKCRRARMGFGMAVIAANEEWPWSLGSPGPGPSHA